MLLSNISLAVFKHRKFIMCGYVKQVQPFLLYCIMDLAVRLLIPAMCYFLSLGVFKFYHLLRILEVQDIEYWKTLVDVTCQTATDKNKTLYIVVYIVIVGGTIESNYGKKILFFNNLLKYIGNWFVFQHTKGLVYLH